MSATKVGRLMMRVEGEWWNAYYGDAPDNAVHLGSIRMSLVTDRPGTKGAFVNLMQECVGQIVKDATGQTAMFGDPEMAPEHERSGSA